MQRGGPGRDGCRAPGAHKCSERAFEVGDFFAKDKAGVVDDTLDGRIDFSLDAGVLRFEVNERNLNNAVSFLQQA